MLADLHIAAVKTGPEIALAAVDRTAEALNPVTRKGHLGDQHAVSVQGAAGNGQLAVVVRVVGIAVEEIDAFQGTLLKQALGFFIDIGIDGQVAGKARRDIIAILPFLRRVVGKRVQTDRPGFQNRVGLFLSGQVRGLARGDLIEGGRHVLAVVSFQRMGAVTVHFGDLGAAPQDAGFALQADLDLIFAAALDDGIVCAAVLNERADPVFSVVFPSAVQDRDREQVLPLDHSFSSR